MCHGMPFSARALKKTLFFEVDIVVKTNRNVYRGLYSYRQRLRVITLFRNIFFSYCFRTFCEFAKVFERKVGGLQAAHLHNAAHALSSPVTSGVSRWNIGQQIGKVSYGVSTKTES